MKKLETCLSPEQLALYDLSGKIVVIVDIFRATSCMVAGLGSGIDHIIPVARVEDALPYRNQGYWTAGERNGEKVEGFDIGNSPFEYMRPELNGRGVVTTTTNGTQAISRSAEAGQVVIGAFLNITTVADHLLSQDRDVVIVCSGWKGRFSLEDSVFAGALFDMVFAHYQCECDAALATLSLYYAARSDLYGYLKSASHFQRLSRLHVEKDLRYCLQRDEFRVLPVLKSGRLVPMPASADINRFA